MIRRFPSSNDLLSFFLSPPLCQIIVIFCSSSFFTLWSSHEPEMLWLCCVGSHCPALCGVAPFSVCQPPNLTSYFPKEEWTSCFKLILSVALVCAVEHTACSGFTQRDINSSWRSGGRVIKSKKTNALSDLSALCFVCLRVVMTFCASRSVSKHSHLPQYELLSREPSEKKFV